MSDLAKIVYFGSDAICLPGLEYLRSQAADRCELVAVVSQPDRRKGRGKKLTPNPVAAWAQTHGIALLQPEKPGAALAEWLAGRSVDVGLVMAYGHFLGRRLREAPRHGLLNFHGSLLPKYRGASPVETAVACGESETGVCLMRVDAKMDAGAVADAECVRIGITDTGPVVRSRIGEAVVPLLERNLDAILSGTLGFCEQDASRATFCRKLSKEDARIDFTLAAKAIHDRIRGFSDWPGACFDHGEVRIKVGSAVYTEDASNAAPGTVIDSGSELLVAAGAGAIRFEQLQRPGGKMLPVADFLRGHPVAVGERLGGGEAKPLLVEA